MFYGKVIKYAINLLQSSYLHAKDREK